MAGRDKPVLSEVEGPVLSNVEGFIPAYNVFLLIENKVGTPAKDATMNLNHETSETPCSSGRLTERTLIVAVAGMAVIGLFRAAFITRYAPLSMNWALTVVILVLLGLFVLIGALYGLTIADGFYQLFQQLPAVLDRLRSTLEQYPWRPALIDRLSRAGGTLTDLEQLSKIAGIFSTVFGALGSLFIVIVLGFYFAFDPKTYIDGTVYLFPEERRGLVWEAFNGMGTFSAGG